MLANKLLIGFWWLSTGRRYVNRVTIVFSEADIWQEYSEKTAVRTSSLRPTFLLWYIDDTLVHCTCRSAAGPCELYKTLNAVQYTGDEW